MSRPVVVYYYMDGCPHCEATWPAWRKLRSSAEASFQEVESKDAEGISGFPTFVVLQGTREVKRISGEQRDAKALAKALGLRRKPTGGRRTYRRRRTLRHRTLRNYIALR
jgi:thiol-disulfide isomerase/thioredoxin